MCSFGTRVTGFLNQSYPDVRSVVSKLISHSPGFKLSDVLVFVNRIVNYHGNVRKRPVPGLIACSEDSRERRSTILHRRDRTGSRR